MSDMTAESTQMQITISRSLKARLEAEAARLALSLDDFIGEALENYLDETGDDADDDYETPDEEILADFREAWHAAMTGQTMPARQALAELRQELGLHDDQG
jgi:hypothetical protein